MDTQPGNEPGPSRPLVRPVVYRPSAPTPLRKMPFNARHMPVGVSANTINVASHIRSLRMRRIVFLGVPLAILLAVVTGVWLLARSLSPLGGKVLDNDIYEYRFLYYKTAEAVNLAQGQGLQDSNRSIVIARPTAENTYTVCSGFGAGWATAFTVPVEGRDVLACEHNDSSYLVIFYHGERRHLFEITYTTPQKDRAEVRKIMSSIQVSVP